MEGSILIFVVLCLGTDALTVEIPKDLYEFARGDNITLPCTFKPKVVSIPLVIVTWTAQSDKPGSKESLVGNFYSTGQTDIPPMYEHRASLDVDVKTGKANLKLNSITLADNRIFECRVQIPGDDEGKLADTARLVVLVAPSVPICKIEGKAEYGQDINLTCKSEEGSPPPTYKWDNRDVRNHPRAPQPKSTDKGGVLSLYNITKETSGYYICTSRNKIRFATCNITLSVMPPSINIGSTAGIIGGVVAALIVFVVIIYCCCCRKKKDKQDEYVMGAREDEYKDKEPVENGESRRADGQEDVRSDVDESSVRGGPARRDRYEDRSERDYDDRSDYDDRHRRDYDDRHREYDDRRSDYDDRRSDYSDRRDRNERYDDERHYDDERRYNDSRVRRRDDDDRYDEPNDDDHDRPPSVPASKPPRRD